MCVCVCDSENGVRTGVCMCVTEWSENRCVCDRMENRCVCVCVCVCVRME